MQLGNTMTDLLLSQHMEGWRITIIIGTFRNNFS